VTTAARATINLFKGSRFKDRAHFGDNFPFPAVSDAGHLGSAMRNVDIDHTWKRGVKFFETPSPLIL
jgi:hypothetical protein